eukprot:5037718-Prymnesium_polylepis.1
MCIRDRYDSNSPSARSAEIDAWSMPPAPRRATSERRQRRRLPAHKPEGSLGRVIRWPLRPKG